jgi:hypothetical protein
VGLTVREDLADVIDQPLHLVDVPRFLSLHDQGSTDDLGGCRVVQERASPGSSEARTRGFEMSALRSSCAFCVSFVQQKELDILVTCTGEYRVPPAGTRTTEGCKAPHEPLDVLDIPDLAYFSDG